MSTYLNVIAADQHSPSRDQMATRLKVNAMKLGAESSDSTARVPGMPHEAADFIAYEFRKLGCDVRQQRVDVGGLLYQHIEAEITGSERSDEILVIGARYDISYEAHGKNGGGLVCLFEIADGLIGLSNRRTIRLVVFINEGANYSVTPFMERYLYAERGLLHHEKLFGMVILDIPRCNAERHASLSDGFPINSGSPQVALIGGASSHILLRLVEQAFRRSCDIPVKSMFAPGAQGVTIAVDRISYGFLAEIAEGLTGAVFELAGDT